MPLNPLSGNPLRTREDVQRATADLFGPLLPYFSASGARVRLSAMSAHFDQAAAELEGFARPLWGIAPLVAGGGDFEHWALYRQGLVNGTDPHHPDYWGDVSDTDQRQVELAAIGLALRIARPHIWDPLAEAEKQRVAAYLTAGRNREYVNNNWKFFRIMVDLGLNHCGVEADEKSHEAYLDEIDGFYMDNGWYRDGPIRSADHYIPFAFHFYALIYAVLSADGKRAALYRDRAETFAHAIRHWYADDGAALPFGRSLTYRFAHAGFWGALAYAGVEALPWGQIKGYYLRNLRFWARQPIFERDGVLSVGYGYPNLLVSEGYNSAGSPYWAMKAFLPLALPEDHPFWTAEEEMPGPVNDSIAMPEPGMIVQKQPGHTVALTSGQYYARWRGTPEKYAKFAYSTRYGFSIEANERYFPSAACDNMLVLSDDGLHFRGRELCEAALIAGDRLYSKWRPYADVEIDTWLIPAGAWHIRVHEITSEREMQLAEGGFALAKPEFGNWMAETERGRALVHNGVDISLIAAYDDRKPVVMSPLSNTNIMTARTLLPRLNGMIGPGRTELACAVLARPQQGLADSPQPPSCPTVGDLRDFFDKNGRVVTVFDTGR